MQFACNHVTERDFNSFQSLLDLSLFPYCLDYVLIWNFSIPPDKKKGHFIWKKRRLYFKVVSEKEFEEQLHFMAAKNMSYFSRDNQYEHAYRLIWTNEACPSG